MKTILIISALFLALTYTGCSNSKKDSETSLDSADVSAVNGKTSKDSLKLPEISSDAKVTALNYSQYICKKLDKAIESSGGDRQIVNEIYVRLFMDMEKRLGDLAKDPDFNETLDEELQKCAAELEKKYPEYYKSLEENDDD